MARKRTENASDPLEEIKMGRQWTRAKKYTKSTNEKPHESGRHNCVSGGRQENSPSQGSAEALSPTGKRLIHLKEPAQEVPTLHSGNVLQPSGKLKLQLFPIDDHTREGLEKDGFHPYLELTLSSRKKISSVLNHLHSKWGSSQIAQGEPTLYPYDKLVYSTGYKWTANRNGVVVGDVYAALGAPAVFRLRYGWSSETENTASESPTGPISCATDFQCESTQKGSSNKAESVRKQIRDGDNLSRLSCEDKATNLAVSEKILPDEKVQSEDNNNINDCCGPTLFPWDDLTNLSIGGLLSEGSLRSNFGSSCRSSNGETSTLWVDNLTNISIGGLLSEASLQGRLSNPEQESNPNNAKVSAGGLLSEASGLGRFRDCDNAWKKSGASMHQSPLISDSLDAFLISRTDKPRSSCAAAPSEPRSSILDAEDTCHAFAFPFGNLSSPWKCTTTSKIGQDAADSVTTGEKGGGQEEGVKQKAESECEKPLIPSQLFNQESSLGLSGIKWADSLGSIDFGHSSSQKVTGGDSISFGAIVNNSMQKTPGP